MPYIGNIPPAEFRSIDYQDFTGVTGSPVKRGFTLTSPVGSANDLEIFVNNVRQEPGVAYTVSGTTLTMTGDVETTDDFYVVYQGKAVASVVPPDGSVSTAKIADDAVTSAKLDTNIEVSGILTEPNKEYFQVNLTATVAGIADSTQVTVDFGGSGTVQYDTKSNFDSSNDAYLLDSSSGVYLISFAIAISSDAINTEVIEDAGAQVEVATDGSTFTGLFGGSYRPNDSGTTSQMGSVQLAGTYIYKATTATTKLRLAVIADTASSDTYELRRIVNENMQGLQFSTTTAHGSYFSVVRIA